MFGAVLMKRGKDGKDKILGAEDMKSAEAKEEAEDAKCVGVPFFCYDLLAKAFERPKTYERLVHDLYVAGWTIKEVKTLLNQEEASPD